MDSRPDGHPGTTTRLLLRVYGVIVGLVQFLAGIWAFNAGDYVAARAPEGVITFWMARTGPLGGAPLMQSPFHP